MNARRNLITGVAVVAAYAALSSSDAEAAKFSDYYSFLSVKDPDYGAKGDGVTDDRAAIQACFDAAFGSSASPHGNSAKYTNKCVFFPAGNYIVSGPLYLTGVFGGRIMGAGQNCTRISFSGTLTQGNTVAQGSLSGGDIALVRAITPVIMINGWAYSHMEGLNIAIANSDGNQVCMYIFWNGSADAGPTHDSYHDMLFEGASVGVLIGYKTPGLCSEQTFVNCTAANCTSYGFRNISQNSLNNLFVGGGAAGCAIGFSCPTGNIQLVGCSLADNTSADIAIGQNPMVISGARTETSTSAPFIDLTAGTIAYLNGCIQDDAGGTGPFAAMGGAGGRLIADGCVEIATNSARGKITGSGADNIYLRGNDFRNTSYLSSYTGLISELDIPIGLVSALPTAATKYKGLRAMVTDANATTFLSTVAGSGANTVPVVCDGTNWKIG